MYKMNIFQYVVVLICSFTISRIKGAKRIQCRASWNRAADADRFTVVCNRVMDSYASAYPHLTKCRFNCNRQYYQKSGNKELKCLKNDLWDAQRIQCEESKCPVVPRLSKHISIASSLNCFKDNLKIGQLCEFKCAKGYYLRGPSIIECLSSARNKPVGKWTSHMPKCKDFEKPTFDKRACNGGIYISKNTEPGKDYAMVKFEFNVTDNSGDPVQITCRDSNDQQCHYQPGKTYKFGITRITYITFKATDSSGNYGFCYFNVKVEDTEKPKLLGCPNNIVKVSTKRYEVITWKKPLYSDNCGINCSLTINPSINSGSKFYFQSGPITVFYTAVDPSDNRNDECRFTVEIKEKKCPEPKAPQNGVVVYSSTGIAQMKCQKGYSPDRPISIFFVCNPSKEYWINAFSGTKFFPDCVKHNGISNPMYEFQGDCSSPSVQNVLKAKFAAYFSTKAVMVRCGNKTLVL